MLTFTTTGFFLFLFFKLKQPKKRFVFEKRDVFLYGNISKLPDFFLFQLFQIGS